LRTVRSIATVFASGLCHHEPAFCPCLAQGGVSFPLDRNETLALVGESGFGKSVTAFTIMGLVSQPQGRVSAGCILLDGVDLRTLDEARFEALRGDCMTMVFQKPMTSLNPVMSVGRDC
jgi:peptide/nickel transport system ATP-binding protein